MKTSKKWLLPAVLLTIAVLAVMFYMENTVSQAETIPRSSIKNQLEVMYNGKVDQLRLDDDKYEARLTRAGSVYALVVEGDTGKVLTMDLVSAAPDLAAAPEDSNDEEAGEDSKGSGKESPAPDKASGTSAAPSSDPSPAPQVKPDARPAAGKAPAEQPVKQEPAKTAPPAPAVKPRPKPNPAPPAKQPAPPQTPPQTVLLTEQQAVQIALRQLNGEVDDVDFVKTTDGGYYLVEIEIDVDDGPDEATYQIHAISGKVMSVTWDD